MKSKILQVRDVPESVIATLRGRAAREGISLSAYVRNLLAAEAQQPTMEEALARIASLPPLEISTEEIVAIIHEGRR